MKKTSLIVGLLALGLLLTSIAALGASVKIGDRTFCGPELEVKAYVEEGDLHIVMILPHPMSVFPFYQGQRLLLSNGGEPYFFPAGRQEIVLEGMGWLGPQEVIVLAGCYDIVEVAFSGTSSGYLSVSEIEEENLWRYCGCGIWVGRTVIPARVCSAIKPEPTSDYEPYQCFENCPRGCSLPWCWAWRPLDL